MVTVVMNEDIRKKEVKTLGFLTTRQAITVGLSLLYSVPIAIYLPIEDMVAKVFIGGLLAIPVASCGWIKMDGQPLEVLIIRLIIKHFIVPSKRKTKSSAYTRHRKAIYKDREKERMSKLTPAQRKEYKKKKAKGMHITYSKKKNMHIYR